MATSVEFTISRSIFLGELFITLSISTQCPCARQGSMSFFACHGFKRRHCGEILFVHRALRADCKAEIFCLLPQQLMRLFLLLRIECFVLYKHQALNRPKAMLLKKLQAFKWVARCQIFEKIHTYARGKQHFKWFVCGGRLDKQIRIFQGKRH